MTGPYKIDPAVNGLDIIRWYQDFVTNPTSRARQIAASHLFIQATAQTHASAPAPARAVAAARYQTRPQSQPQGLPVLRRLLSGEPTWPSKIPRLESVQAP